MSPPLTLYPRPALTSHHPHIPRMPFLNSPPHAHSHTLPSSNPALAPEPLISNRGMPSVLSRGNCLGSWNLPAPPGRTSLSVYDIRCRLVLDGHALSELGERLPLDQDLGSCCHPHQTLVAVVDDSKSWELQEAEVIPEIQAIQQEKLALEERIQSVMTQNHKQVRGQR